MEGWGISTYGDAIADIYDDLYEDLFLDKDAQVEFLAELARGGRTLELAIGTGRVALPLAAKGVEVHGIDASAGMVERLKAKPGGTDIKISYGDMADVDVDGEFGLVFVVFNSFFALTSQEDQVRCFANVARHLTDEGVFVLSAFVPDVSRYRNHQDSYVHEVGLGRTHVVFSRHDPVAQTVTSNQMIIGTDGIKQFPVFLRYAWPSELDLMARLAGLELKDRFADWSRKPFDSSSQHHVSLYGKA
jgi:SAM-dependent methyltransferase